MIHDLNLNNPVTEQSQDDWKILREMKWQETELTNHRISWMVTFHSLLVAAVSFAWGKENNEVLLIGFTVAGIIVSISSWVSLHIGMKATESLESWWETYGPKYESAPPLIGFDANKVWKFPLWFILPWHFWPIFSAAGWLLLMLYVIGLPNIAHQPTACIGG